MVNFKIYDVTVWFKTNYNSQLPNISRSKDNQTMKFGQLIEPNKRIFFSKNHSETDAERLVPDLSLFFKKGLYKVNLSGL